MALVSTAYDVHGVTFCVEAHDAQLLEAIGDLLRPFAAPSVLLGDVRAPSAWQLTLDASVAPASVEQKGQEWFALGPMRCFGDEESTLIRYADVPVARLLSTPHRIDVWIPPALDIAMWDVGHALVLPLLVEALRVHGRYHLHAASLADATGRVALFPAESGSGKTTLTLALARAGFAYLTDDATLLCRTPHAQGDSAGGHITALNFPERVNVTATTANYFPELQAYWQAAARNMREKVPIDCGAVFGTPTLPSGPVAAIFFPAVGSEDRSTLVPLTASETLFGLLSQTLPSPVRHHTTEQFALFSDLATQVPGYQLHVGRDFDALPRLIAERLA